MSNPNDTQVAGNHYKAESDRGNPQHWDLVVTYDWDYFQSQITKYLMRWKTKHDTAEKRLEDLKKARHFLDKYIFEEELKLERDKLLRVSAVQLGMGATARSIGQASVGAQEMRQGATPRHIAQKEDLRLPASIESNQWWTNEGYYGDMTQLYKCRQCSSTVRTSHTPPAHGCALAGRQNPALEANLQRVEAGDVVGGLGAGLVAWPPLETGEADAVHVGQGNV